MKDNQKAKVLLCGIAKCGDEDLQQPMHRKNEEKSFCRVPAPAWSNC
jgi:hypothetical protein